MGYVAIKGGAKAIEGAELAFEALRTAEGEQGTHRVRDHDRTLSERGRGDARRMGRHLAGNDLVPR